MHKLFRSYSIPKAAKILILACTAFLAGLNAVCTLKNFVEAGAKNKNSIFLKPGGHFADFKSYLLGQPAVGFITDKDISAENNDGKFLEAQYILAPTRLDLNNPNHAFIILDCTSMLTALDMMNDLNAEPVTVNSYGKILAKRLP